MTSFIDLMASDVWTDADITRRTEAMVRKEFSVEAETVLNRKVVAMGIGQYEPTAADMFEMARFRDVVEAAHDAGVAARADMALLAQVLALEAAHRRLAQPLPPDDAPPEDTAADAAERAAAQAVVDGAQLPVRNLFDLRNGAV